MRNVEPHLWVNILVEMLRLEKKSINHREYSRINVELVFFSLNVLCQITVGKKKSKNQHDINFSETSLAKNLTNRISHIVPSKLEDLLDLDIILKVFQKVSWDTKKG